MSSDQRTPAHTVALLLFAAMALAQIAVPLAGDAPGLTTLVVALFAATTTALAVATWGWPPALVTGTAVVAGAVLVERIGVETGLPFGDYAYSGRLQPQVAGVPLAVALAWWAMAVPARAVAAHLTSNPLARVVLGSIALTAWDVMLDPQLVEDGGWTWVGGGAWRDVPLSNYAGWLVVGAGAMALLDRLLPPRPSAGAPLPAAEVGLLGLYSWWAVMSTLGHLVFFGDPIVGMVGGLAMLPLPALAWRRVLSRSSG